jgi:ABC-type transport system involved in multi-copper enzyme maturation permease subunit
MSIIHAHLGWFVAAAIVVVGLLVLGFKDTLRFSFGRAWTISGVTFDEAIRRKVLWITPLAMLGVIIVSQLQRPFDELDAVQQTIKFSLFATALVLVVAILILACTSLPREIENRVIYTILTKPTTRLELVLGKIMGFARVSAAILILMGLFTYVYLHVRSSSMRAYIAERLQHGQVEASSRATLEHYLNVGLLDSKTYAAPVDVQIYGRAPVSNEPFRWMTGGSEQNFLVPFELTADDLTPPGAAPGTVQPGAAGLAVLARMDFQTHELTDKQAAEMPPEPTTAPASTQPAIAGPPIPGAPPATAPAPPPPPSPKKREGKPLIQVQILSAYRFTLVPPNEFNGGKPADLPPYDSNQPAQLYLSPDHTMSMAQHIPPGGSLKLYVMVEGLGEGVDYKVGRTPVQLYVPGINGASGRVIDPAKSKSGEPATPIFRGRSGTYGEQLRGGPDVTATAVYRFRHSGHAAQTDKEVPFEMKVNIERDEDASEKKSDITDVALVFRNADSGKTFPPVMARPESMRTTYINVPADAIAGGNFDVQIRSLTAGHWLGLKADSLRLVTANQPFAWNLFKSLLVMWLMSLLVIIVAIFCSTFVSWPIAVVLTLVILLAHWGVQQLGDSLGPGAGHSIVTDFGFQDPSTAKVVSKSVDALSKALNTMAVALPDISKFASTEQISQGVSVPPSVLWESLEVLLMFGVPLGVAAYVILKHKEVAP